MKSIFRKAAILAITFVFSITQSAFAMKPEHQAHMKEFLNNSGLTQGKVKLKDLYKNVRGSVPADHQKEMDQFIQIYGDYVLPKMTVTKIKNKKGEEDIAIQMTTSKANLVLTIKNDGPLFATVTGTENGKVINQELKHQDIWQGPLYFMRTLAGEPTEPQQEYFLSYDEIQKLSPEEKKTYFTKVRQVLEAIEKVQNARYQFKTSRVPTFIEMLIDQAYAKDFVPTPGTKCIVAGYIGEYFRVRNEYKTYCKIPDTAVHEPCASNQIRCNYAFYGSKTCIPREGMQAPKNATELCNSQVSKNNIPSENIHELIKNGIDRESFEKEMNGIRRYLPFVIKNCENVVPGKTHTQDQPETCENLKKRLDEIAKYNCDRFKADANKVANFCGSGTGGGQPPAQGSLPPSSSQKPPVANPGNGGGTDQNSGGIDAGKPPGSGQEVAPPSSGVSQRPPPPSTTTPPPPQSTPSVSDQDKADICASSSKFNRLNCESFKPISIECGNGHVVSYCNCSVSETLSNVKIKNKDYPLVCKPAVGSGGSGSRTSSGGSSSGFDLWKFIKNNQSTLLFAGAGAIGLYMWYTSQKKSVDKYYQMWNTPVNPPVPPPQINVPGNYNRPAPSPGSAVR